MLQSLEEGGAVLHASGRGCSERRCEMAVNLLKVEIASVLTLLGRPTLADLDRSALRLSPLRD